MEFKEPPKTEKRRLSDKWAEVAYALRSTPNEWALVGTYSPGVPAQIRQGLYKAFLLPDDPRVPAVQMRQDWEVTTRKSVEGGTRKDVYIRYIGRD